MSRLETRAPYQRHVGKWDPLRGCGETFLMLTRVKLTACHTTPQYYVAIRNYAALSGSKVLS